MLMDNIRIVDRMPFLERFSKPEKKLVAKKEQGPITVAVSAKLGRIYFVTRALESMDMQENYYFSLYFNKENKIISWRVRKAIPDALTTEEASKWTEIHLNVSKTSKSRYYTFKVSKIIKELKLPASQLKVTSRYEVQQFIDKYGVVYYFVDLKAPIANQPATRVLKYTEVGNDFFN
jgi:hypothetical protein